MTVEIRPAKPEEMEEFGIVSGTSLGMMPEIFQRMQPDWTLCCFENGKLVTSYGTWPLTMRFNGEGVPAAGGTAVGTRPMYRRRGHLRELSIALHKSLYEKGERPLIIGIPSLAAIYHRYGRSVVSYYNSYNVEPRYVQLLLDSPIEGEFRDTDGKEEAELLEKLFQRFIEDRTGYIHRRPGHWSWGVLAAPPPGGLLSTIIYEEDGKPTGYLVYFVQNMSEWGFVPRLRLVIRDLVWLTTTAYRAIWEYLSRMDIASNIIWAKVPPDDPLPHIIQEPRMLNITSHDGVMARIIDIEKALPRRYYPEEATLTFEITDDMCPWNTGRWQLETAPDGAAIKHTTAEPQLNIPISTLALLAFGQVSASEAARMGRLDVTDHGALPLWDKAMRTKYQPFCPDFF